MAEATVNIPKDVLTPIINAQIATVLSEALGTHSHILSEAVARVLSQKVDRDGKPQDYSGNPEFITWLVSNALRDAVKIALTEAMTHHKDVVRAALLKELTRKNSPLIKQLVTGMVSGVFDPARLNYRVDVKIDAAS